MKFTIAQYTVRPERVKEVRKAIARFISAIARHEPHTLFVVFREEGRHTFFHWMAFPNDAAERRHALADYNVLFTRKVLPHCVGQASFTECQLVASSRKHWTLPRAGGPPAAGRTRVPPARGSGREY